MRHLLALVLLLTCCVATPRSVCAVDETPPAGMPKGYHISDESTSPNGRYAIIQADPDVVDEEKARNFLVALKPFRQVAELPGFAYFDHANHRSMVVNWAADSSTALVMVGGKWGTLGASVVRIESNGKARTADLVAEIQKLFLPSFRASKVTRYNDVIPFIFDEDNAWDLSTDGQRVTIDVHLTNDPKGAMPKNWSGQMKGVWSVQEAKWLSRKISTDVTKTPPQ